MKIIKDIHFNGRITEEITSLPCVEAIQKDPNGKTIITIKPDTTLGRTTVRIGDHIMQFKTGSWQVFGARAAEQVSRKGT